MRRSETAGAFDAIETGRLTWLGLTIAALGWALLIAATSVADLLLARLPRSAAPSFHADLVDIAICLIGSGFALAIIGALQSGFGALNRFFEAVLMRSAQRQTPIERADPAPIQPEPAQMSRKRPYRVFADGSVEVDTIVGTRKFETLAEAREFI